MIDPGRSLIDDDGSANIPPLLASTYGGPIAVRTDKNQTAIPETAQYRLQFKADQANMVSADWVSQLRGTLR